MSDAQELELRRKVGQSRRIVVKIGSSLLTDHVTGLDTAGIARWSEELAQLLEQGRQVVLVSSGAVAEGMARLALKERPESLNELQAAAAVGQMGLVQAYERAFAAHQRHTAMMLLTHEDLADRQRYLNARATLTTLLDFGVVPIINENDSVATDEIRFGDNDTLAALVTSLLPADLLVVLTDRAGLHEADPRERGDAPVVQFADADDPRLDAMVSAGAGSLGRGGMVSKLAAARLAAHTGAHTIIACGSEAQVFTRIAAGEPLGTLLRSNMLPLDARKRWIAGQLKPKGTLVLDTGAVTALKQRGVSLLPVGVSAVTGTFERGDVVRCVDPDGRVVAQGFVNYSSGETTRLLGVASVEIGERLGYRNEPELVHRDNLVLRDGL